MTEINEVKFVMKAETPWRVGYAIKANEIFIFKFDSDDICWAIGKLGLNCGPAELLVDNAYIDLGEL